MSEEILLREQFASLLFSLVIKPWNNEIIYYDSDKISIISPDDLRTSKKVAETVIILCNKCL
jgi:Leu/Phe-tRNA-protein transferase